jgi:hypothetical protein
MNQFTHIPQALGLDQYEQDDTKGIIDIHQSMVGIHASIPSKMLQIAH